MDVTETIATHDAKLKFIVKRIAARLPSHVDSEDLYNMGVIGLIDAIDKFDPALGVKFATYAEYRIKGAIMDGLRTLDWVPRSIRLKEKKLEAAEAKVAQKFGRRGTEQEIAEAVGLPLDKFHRLVRDVRGTSRVSLDNPASDDSVTISETIPDAKAESPLEALKLSEANSDIANAIAELPEKEGRVVSLYFFGNLNMKEIGKRLGVTEGRVSQLRTKALKRLRVSIDSRALAA